MTSRPAITYVLAVHNSTAFLAEHVRKLVTRLGEFPLAEIILVENGSSDGSLELSRELAARHSTNTISIHVDTVAKGLGNAFRRGIAMSHGELLVIVGCDLPFGFSDLDQRVRMTTPAQLVLGSKSHPQSRINVTLGRRVMSTGFRIARTLILGIRAGDTQGSIIIGGDLARRLQPYLACADYLVSTEIVAWAMHFGARPVEIPVDYPGSGTSTVSPLGDGMRMMRGMVAMRGRLRKEGRMLSTASHVAPPT